MEQNFRVDLSNRVAVVTGATGGIGRAIVTELYRQGALVVMTGRDLDKLHILRDELFALGSPAPTPMCLAADLTHPDIEEQIIAQTIKYCDRLDILVNNAGIVDGRLLLRSDNKYLTDTMHINFTVPYNLMRAAIPHMQKNLYGRIINITSIAGYMGDAGMSGYAASKGALASATKSIAAEYGRRGITANCIAPGIVATDAIQKIPAQRQNAILREIPLRRFANPPEVAYMVAFLASENAAYITGQQIHLNGGLIR